MIINFSEKLESIQNDKRKKEIVCQCAIESFIAVTQEVNSILMILKSEGINPNDIACFVENNTDRITPRLLQKLTDVQGNNLVRLSKKLKKDLAKHPQLTQDEIEILDKMEREIGAEYFLNNETIISRKLDKYLTELLEMDSI